MVAAARGREDTRSTCPLRCKEVAGARCASLSDAIYAEERSLALAIDGLWDRGGTERQIVAIGCGMQARGWNVRVLSRWGLDPNGEHAEELRAAGVAVVVRPISPVISRRVRSIRARVLPAAEELRSMQAAFGWIGHEFARGEIVHEIPYFGRLPGPARRLYARRRAPIVHTILGTPSDPVQAAAPWAVVTSDGSPVVRHSEPVEWIPCMTSRRIQPTRHSSGETCDLLFVGRLVKSKGVDLLLRALDGVDVRCRLTVIGDGPEREYLEEVAPDGVRFIGSLPMEEVLLAMASADVVVVPSRREGVELQEGMPTVISEALACGCPVLATDVGGIKHIFTAGGEPAGWLVKPDSVDALRAAISAAGVANLTSLRRGAANAYRRLLDPDVVLAKYEAAYERAVRRLSGQLNAGPA